MYKKVEQLLCKCGDYFFRNVIITFFILICINCIIITKNGEWDSAFNYNETGYTNLEIEANRMIETKDFETNYSLFINDYSNVTNKLNFSISNENGESVTADIINYGEEKQKVNIQRNIKDSKSAKLNFIFILVSENLLYAVLAMIFLAAILSLLCIIFNCIENKNSKYM